MNPHRRPPRPDPADHDRRWILVPLTLVLAMLAALLALPREEAPPDTTASVMPLSQEFPPVPAAEPPTPPAAAAPQQLAPAAATARQSAVPQEADHAPTF